MRMRSLQLGLAVLSVQLLVLLTVSEAQEMPAAAAQAEELPPVPRGIEVLARGPVHEAFASLAGEPVPTQPVAKQPPRPIEEMPPAEKPEGNVLWISGYWAWDDERKDYLWVSGVWRTPPPGKQWIAGYWREEGERWQWVPGFWTAAAEQQDTKEVAYLPQPPEPPEVAPPGRAPAADCFYVPGSWVWNPAAGTYAWRAGYWARVQTGYVWVPDHYRWTPSGYVYIPGYWDLAVSRRGVLYAPVVIDPAVVTTSFYYTPAYAVSDTVVVDSLFVRPAYAHYYFGDYYGPAYSTMGYESVVVYGGRRYDSIVVYETWAHRSQPSWYSIQIDIYNGRSRGLLPVPPRTLVQQNTIIQQNITNVTNVTNVTNNTANITNNITNNTTTVNRATTNYNMPVLGSASKIAAANGVKTVPLDTATRVQARQQAAAVQQVALQRTATEQPLPPGAPRQARVASFSVPKAQAVQPGFVAPKVTPAAAGNAQAAHPMRPATAPTQGLSAPSQAGAAHPGTPLAHPVAPNAPSHPGTAGTPTAQTGTHVGSTPTLPNRGGPLVAPGVHPSMPSAQPGRPPVPNRPPPPVPARKPPPKDNKEHH
jgi:hypothetical protein